MKRALSAKDKQGIALIAGVLILLLIAFAANYSLSGKQRPDDLNCVSPITRKTVVVIDRSDKTPRQTVDEVAARIRNYVSEQAQENELISIYEVTAGATTSLSPVFQSCVPRKDGNDLYEHRRSIQKFYENKFVKPLSEVLTRPATTSESSPIAEVLTDLSASEAMRSQSTRLMVFSDMLQNSRNGSLYGCTNAREAISTYRTNKSGSIVRPEFKNTAVELHLIPREGLPSAAVQCRSGFWTWFFGDSSGDGSGLDFKPLPGGAPVNG